jgi:AAA family ATPase
LKDVQKNYPIKITDEKLFEIYAKEQWMGNAVKKGDYLFDQRIIPDYAFRVVKVLPRGEALITESTVIEIESQGEAEAKPAYVTFRDIIGHEEVKRKCKVVMKYLRDPARFGEWAPRNILFYGPPGTGKTMTAKALANETSSALFLIRATDLIGEYVGDGSKRIHELFQKASERAPSVIFVDELDAIGLDRAYQAVRGDVSEVVNALLTELDGLQENKGIVTIAATNNPLILDSALRSRFEEEMEFKLPTREERLKILQHYARKSPLKIKASLREYAARTEGLSGRDLKEKLLKAALHRAILEDSEVVTEKHLEAAFKSIPLKPRPPGEMFT